jgi:hypothetical protein
MLRCGVRPPQEWRRLLEYARSEPDLEADIGWALPKIQAVCGASNF